jgi:hypothetical protein
MKKSVLSQGWCSQVVLADVQVSQNSSLGAHCRVGFFGDSVGAMPTYDVYVLIKSRRLRYPRGLHVPSLDAAHRVALMMGRMLFGRGHQEAICAKSVVTSTLRSLTRMAEPFWLFRDDE